MQAELPTLYGTDPYFYVKLGQRHRQPDGCGDVRNGSGAAVHAELPQERTETETEARLSIFDAQFQFGVLKVHYYADW